LNLSFDRNGLIQPSVALISIKALFSPFFVILISGVNSGDIEHPCPI
jgi:hypothetical protein